MHACPIRIKNTTTTYELPADARTPSKKAFKSTPFCFAIITASPAATRWVACRQAGWQLNTGIINE